MIVKQPARQSTSLANYSFWKSRLDFFLAAILLLPALPIIFVLVLIVRATSRGPGIFKQVRTGKNGKSFTMYKLRSMRIDAESAATGPVWAKPDDPRTTSFGRWLRHTHLDELPQLFNVLQGEMSLVGPRPERPEIVATLVKKIPGYGARLEVVPGVTGLAQVNLPPDSDLESVRQKLFLDREYINTVSFWLDLRLLMYTFAGLFGIDDQWLTQFFKLHRNVPNYTAWSVSENQSHNLDGSLCDASDKAHQLVGVLNPSAIPQPKPVASPPPSQFKASTKPR